MIETGYFSVRIFNKFGNFIKKHSLSFSFETKLFQGGQI